VSHHHHTDYVEVVSAKGPVTLSSKMKGLFIAMIVVGLLAFLWAALGDRPRVAWISYVHNLYFFTGLSAGGLLVAVVVQVARAMWGRPLKRFAEAFGAFLVPAIVLVIPLWFFGAEHIYEWMDAKHPDPTLYPHKAMWLSQHFVFARVIGYIVVLFLIGRKFMAHSVRPDLGLAHEKNPDLWSQPANWKGHDQERATSWRGMSVYGVLYCFAFAFMISGLAYDLVMSLDFRWFSSMFGGWQWTSFLLIGWGSLYMVSYVLSNRFGLEKYFHKKLYHDAGKLTFAFTIIWGYLFFAQLIVIWYGNLSHESGFLITRIQGEAWKGYTWTVFFMVFILPFVIGLGKEIKMRPHIFRFVALLSFLGIWMERFVLIAPSAWYFERTMDHGHVGGHFQSGIPMLLTVDFLVFLGFLGLFALTVTHYLYKRPLMVISDPRLDEGINRH